MLFTLLIAAAVFAGTILSIQVASSHTLSTPRHARIFQSASSNAHAAPFVTKGQLVWRSHVTGAPIIASPVVYYGAVYVGSRDNYMYAFNASNGKILYA